VDYADLYGGDPNHLFEGVALPSLKNLHVGSLPADLFDSMVPFLIRSGSSLKAFSLHYIQIIQDVLFRLLFAMPQLETLILKPFQVSYPFLTDRMLNMIAGTARLNDQPDGPFLPKLQSLEYIGYRTFSWKCVPIVFSKALGAPETPETIQRTLRSVKMKLNFSTNENPDPDVVAELQRLRVEEGYEIQIVQDSGVRRRDLLDSDGESTYYHDEGDSKFSVIHVF
jgi:hypothetical protein